jgi:hypothetical protein
MLLTFLYPYVSILHGAAWNIQQNMEGLGIASSNVVQRDPHGHVVSSYWSPAQATIPLLGMLALCSLALAVLFVLSGYVLGRKRGAIGIVAFAGAAWVPPSGFAVAEAALSSRPIRHQRDRALGAPLGFLPLLALGVLLE